MEALLSLSNDLAGAVERAAPSIVAVHARRRLPSTGIHWRPGIVVTADHTVRMEDGITVETADGRARPPALVGRDPGSDLAVLRVADLDTAPAALGDDGALRVGHMVLALGYGPRASWGVISALGPRWRTWRGGEIDRLVRLDLVLYPGFSGGPLVDATGRVIGLNTSGLARESRLALPVATVARVTDELLRKGHVARAYLGIGMQPVRLPEPLRAALGLPGDGGLIVVMVEPDGPAARAGLLLGDVLVALDGAPTGDLEDVQAQLGAERIGTTVTALVVRAGARTEVRITVGERPRRGAS
ncbi:MAG TPA: S1C family serine protease [Candidatus Dormibacteraeota bacterium]|nr:S1C family serine protease [Candidatus Dormibacteraeota bacterium]